MTTTNRNLREWYVNAQITIMDGFGQILHPELRLHVDQINERTEDEFIAAFTETMRNAFADARRNAAAQDKLARDKA